MGAACRRRPKFEWPARAFSRTARLKAASDDNGPDQGHRYADGRARLANRRRSAGATSLRKSGHRRIGRDAADATERAVAEIGWMLKALVAGQVSVRNFAGPVGIVQMSGQAAKEGPTMLLQWTAIISINLGLLNLLPIPILDGGHVLLLLIESGMRRDLSL